MNSSSLPASPPHEATPYKACLELDMPLHAWTDSDAHVARLVGALLNDIANVDHEVSHADILQALAITTAVRAAMADAATQTGANFSLELLDASIHTMSGAVPRAA